MPKKFIIFLGIFFLILALFSAKALLSWKENRNLEALKAKAPEIKITIIEGWTINDISASLEKKGLIGNLSFQNIVKTFDIRDYPILKTLPKNASLEGYLYPDTYLVFEPKKNENEKLATELLKKALDNFSKKFTPEMEKRANLLQLTIHEIITLASIIEKETGKNIQTTEQKNSLEAERKTVAGIFYNRLNSGMALESDATINYITKKNNPTPTLNELASKSPYNTYENKGLPPGPICNPSLSSIIAALYPDKTDYFYFLHKQPLGEVVFSKTFEEHIKNKFKYLK